MITIVRRRGLFSLLWNIQRNLFIIKGILKEALCI